MSKAKLLERKQQITVTGVFSENRGLTRFEHLRLEPAFQGRQRGRFPNSLFGGGTKWTGHFCDDVPFMGRLHRVSRGPPNIPAVHLLSTSCPF